MWKDIANRVSSEGQPGAQGGASRGGAQSQSPGRLQRGGPVLTAAVLTAAEPFSNHGVLIKCRLCGNCPHSSLDAHVGTVPPSKQHHWGSGGCRSVVGYPNIQGDASCLRKRCLVQATGSSSVSAPMLSLTVGHRTLSPKLSRQSGDTWEKMQRPPSTPQ